MTSRYSTLKEKFVKMANLLMISMLLLNRPFLLQAAPEEPKVNADKKTVHQIPTDPKATVISLNYKGGFGTPRIDESPTLSILADGTVLMPATHENRPALQEKISQEQLQELLRFAIDQQQIFKVTNKSIAKQLQQEREALAANANGPVAFAQIADAATTELYIQADGKEHEVSHYPSGLNEDKMDHLVRFKAVQQRLQKFMSITQLGGKQVVAKWLDVANKELKAKYPELNAFTMDDFQGGGKAADGRIFLSFNRSKRNQANQMTEYTSAQINKPADGEAKVNVHHRDDLPVRKIQKAVPGGNIKLNIQKAIPKNIQKAIPKNIQNKPGKLG